MPMSSERRAVTSSPLAERSSLPPGLGTPTVKPSVASGFKLLEPSVDEGSNLPRYGMALGIFVNSI